MHSKHSVVHRGIFMKILKATLSVKFKISNHALSRHATLKLFVMFWQLLSYE